MDLRSYQRCARASLQIVLDGLFVTPAVTAIAEALTSAHVEGKLAVVGNAKLAAALAAKHDVVPIGLSPARREAADQRARRSVVDRGASRSPA